eukprot:5957136-Amphidinium_carterae.1
MRSLELASMKLSSIQLQKSPLGATCRATVQRSRHGGKCKARYPRSILSGSFWERPSDATLAFRSHSAHYVGFVCGEELSWPFRVRACQFDSVVVGRVARESENRCSSLTVPCSSTSPLFRSTVNVDCNK